MFFKDDSSLTVGWKQVIKLVHDAKVTCGLNRSLSTIGHNHIQSMSPKWHKKSSGVYFYELASTPLCFTLMLAPLMYDYPLQPLKGTFNSFSLLIIRDAKCCARQGKFICIAQFRHKATQSALQAHTNYIKIHKIIYLKDIKNIILKPVKH